MEFRPNKGMKRKLTNNLMKTIIVTLLMLVVLTGCSNKETTEENFGTINENVEDVESKNDNLTTETLEESKEENSDDTSLFSFYASMPEEEIVMTIDGVELPLTTTWDNFVKIASENNWTYDEKIADEKTEGEVKTPNGYFEITFMNNPNTNMNEIWKVYVTSNKVPENYINIHGINAKTSKDLLATLLEVDVREEYKDRYYFNEYTTLTFMGGRDTKDNPDVSIARTLFTKR